MKIAPVRWRLFSKWGNYTNKPINFHDDVSLFKTCHFVKGVSMVLALGQTIMELIYRMEVNIYQQNRGSSF